MIPNLEIRTLRLREGSGLPEITQQFSSKALIPTHTARRCKPRTLVYTEYKAGKELIT